MTDDPYHPEPPFVYECADCESRFEADDISGLEPTDELVECPDCGGDLWNLTTPSRE
ncbi:MULTISPECIES: DUF7129 domain-containing putative zinc-binding protein [Halorubrum]|uniref:DUF7129 domain-containing putative zinc-binding protein n=1 Tax=Halorubrum TaxID=56688 RepID=UPI0015D4B78F|nr:hypothetical protein [Halorubrum persicum]